ncbi:MAG: hypothetical protein KAU90_03415 [Sulfurovaceae bacterium]|nr:hypothetical protein [Sulfurovaceae bacterium]
MDKNGNVNINIIDRKVIVNGKVVKTIPKGEPINITVGNTDTSIDKGKMKANVGKNIGAKIDNDSLSANVGGIHANINGDSMNINIGSIVNDALKNRNRKKDDKDDDFFDGDPFFAK